MNEPHLFRPQLIFWKVFWIVAVFQAWKVYFKQVLLLLRTPLMKI